MDEKEFQALVLKVGEDAAKKIKNDIGEAKKEVEKNLEEAFDKKLKGLITEEAFKSFKDDELKKITDDIGTKYDGILKDQGTVIAELKGKGAQGQKTVTLEDVMSDEKLVAQIKEIYKQGAGNVEIDLKTAGVTSIGNTILPMNPVAPNSPYLPGPGALDVNNFFGIIYNPNFITNYVNQGRTNNALLPWINESSVEGAAAAVAEGAPKPAWNTRFIIEFSKAKKIAAFSTITEEFDQDLPGFTTIVKRLLQEEVGRKFDDAVYADVIAAAPGYTITGLNGQVDDANYWDVLRAGIAQIGKNNFNANFIGINPVTNALVEMQKSNTDRLYLLPPFKNRIDAMLHEANKVAENFALVGDIRQYNVDMYKDLVLKVGWNNDDFQRNQFSVVAEIRYHDYISSSRKPALTYFNMNTVRSLIDSGS